jgi:kinesin family member 3B
MSKQEVIDKREAVIKMDPATGTVSLTNPQRPSEPPAQFTYDAVYDQASRQPDVYNETARPIVDSVLQGYNGTVFAYGQTGTGKTFTMEGSDRNDPEMRGVIPNSFHHIFTEIARSEGVEFLVRASYLEIYLDEIRDLLNANQNQRLEVHERPDSGVYVKDLNSYVVKNVREIEKVMNAGSKNRKTGATNMNEHSSRSHAVFIITVERSDKGPDGKDHIRVGKLNLVDLAGSERQKKTGAEGTRLDEASKINQSLAALGNVIAALTEGSKHIPYRDSRLTRMLQDSLGGNSLTVMIANIGPADYNADETGSTLRFASRAKLIKNKPRINEDPKDAMLRQFQEEIERLRQELLRRKGGAAPPAGPAGPKKREKKAGAAAGAGSEDAAAAETEGTEEWMDEEKRKLEEEKEKLANNKSLIDADRQKKEEELENRSRDIEQKVQERNETIKRLQALESKLLKGGVNIHDFTTKQERELEQQQRALEEQRRAERELKQKLTYQQVQSMYHEDQSLTLKEKIAAVTRKIKDAQADQEAIRDIREKTRQAHLRRKEEFSAEMESLRQEIKLMSMIIDNFIPKDEVARVEKRAVYDEAQQTWRLQPVSTGRVHRLPRPASACGFKRPVCEASRLAISAGDPDPRYRPDNVLRVPLDMPLRTTEDYDEPAPRSQMQSALESALRDDDDMSIDARQRDIFSATDKFMDKKGRVRQRNSRRGAGD